ncbi:MAG: hypothetical protein P3B98_02080 [Gemmatimonadota bacterium]|nr:hypothetical protein [Gemmatimonadota bacterium]
MLAGLCEHLRRTRVVGVIVDHIHRANGDSLDKLVEFAEFLDQDQRTSDGGVPERAEPPVTLIFAGSAEPEFLQTRSPSLASLIGGCSAMMAPLSSPDEVKQAIEQGFSLRDPRWSDAAPSLFGTIHEETRGLNTHLRTLMQDAARRASKRDISSIESALGDAIRARTAFPDATEEDAGTADRRLRPEAKPLPPNRRASKGRENAAKASQVLKQRGLTKRPR